VKRTPAPSIRNRLATLLALGAVLAPLPTRAIITPANVASLVTKWDFPVSGSVTGDLIVADGVLYIPSTGGSLYAVDPVTGTQIWAQSFGTLLGPVTPTDDGGLCFGTIAGQVYCINAADASTRWTVDLKEPAPGAVWSGVLISNGRVFVGIASISDQPCTRGRLVALDLKDGHELWRFYTVPDKVCSTETSTECTTDDGCPNGGTCVKGIGGGVTATPTVDPTGSFVYMNTVGCFTNPSIGESDSAFKLDAATGEVIWRNRVNPPEQFGACENDPSIDCGCPSNTLTGGADCGPDARCAGVGGTCRRKGNYHDFGFLNGPLRLTLPAEGGGTVVRIVSGSKNGTLYSFDEATGQIVWKNAVKPIPVTPGFAGFGLFNGALAFAEGRIHAALYKNLPPRVCANDPATGCTSDAQCGVATCLPEPRHLMAFDAATGDVLWAEEIGPSWSHVAVANGVVYAGTQDSDDNGSKLFAHDARDGTRLATFEIPAGSVARAAVLDDSVLVGYGSLLGPGSGGVRALSLCSNGVVDAGEECDDGNTTAGDCCSPSCTFETVACDDGDACTTGDVCGSGQCAGRIATVEQIGCSLAQLGGSPCGAEALPASLSKSIAKAVKVAQSLLARAAKAAARGKTAKVEALRKRALAQVDALGTRVEKAAQATKPAKKITPACQTTLAGLLATRRSTVSGFQF
jgi:cysteine-rich repeat protein